MIITFWQVFQVLVAFVVIGIIYVDFGVCRKKNRCKGSNGVSYYPFPVLCRDTTMVSRQEGRGTHGKHVYAHDRRPVRAHAGVPGEGYRNRPLFSLCRDRVGSPCVATGVF